MQCFYELSLFYFLFSEICANFWNIFANLEPQNHVKIFSNLQVTVNYKYKVVSRNIC